MPWRTNRPARHVLPFDSNLIFSPGLTPLPGHRRRKVAPDLQMHPQNKTDMEKCMSRSIEPASARRAMLGLYAMTALTAVGMPVVASAGPAESIYSPIVEYREWELELKGGVQDFGNRDVGEIAYKFTFGYGIAPRWHSEVEIEYPRAPGNAARVEEIELENIFQLTEHGEHWLDVGIFNEISHNRLEHKNFFAIGPMFQQESGRSQVNLNLLWTRQTSAVQAGEEGDSRNELSYAAQWKWNAGPRFQPGVQAFGSLGDPAHARSQELRFGPAFFGKANLADGKSLKYNAALLGGLTRETPNTTLRFQLEYEFF